MTINSNALRSLQSAISGSVSSGDSSSYVNAIVESAGGDEIWVRFDGSDTLTPVESTFSAVNVGDSVSVRVADGKASIVGNMSAPATDDTAANDAKQDASDAIRYAETAKSSADQAASDAATAKSSADQAISDAASASTAAASASASAASAGVSASRAQAALDTMGDYDWDADEFDAEKSLFYKDELGAHIVDARGEGGTYRTDINSSGMEVSEIATGSTVASFGADGATIGNTSGRNIRIDSGGLHVFLTGGTDGSEDEIAHLGYGSGNNDEEGTSDAPFYTLGYRDSDESIGNWSLASGYSTCACGFASHSEGHLTSATGRDSHAEGFSTIASGIYSHAEGERTTASGKDSHAEGVTATASGFGSHAEGAATTASGAYSHAEGFTTTASGVSSHADGIMTNASGDYSHAEGSSTEAVGDYSHAQNLKTIAAGECQTAIGKYNVSDETSALIIGNGTAYQQRANALTVDWEGNVDAAGDVSCNQLSREGSSKSWYNGRDGALVRTTTCVTDGGYTPAVSMKTTSGSWEIGTFKNEAEKLAFSYVPDTSYNASTNPSSGRFFLTSDGGFSGHISWNNVDDKPSTYPATGHTHTVISNGSNSLTMGSTGTVTFNSVGTGKTFRPTTSGDCYLGVNSYRWKVVYASTTSINSSKYVKKNVKPIEDEEALRLLDVNTVSFDYIDGTEKDCRGVIAEEVHELFPHVVVDWGIDYDQEGNRQYPGVDYSKFVPELIKLCQIQQREIEELKQRLERLGG